MTPTRKPRPLIQKMRCVKVDDDTHALLTRLGNDNFSRGIRLITAGRLGENGREYFRPVVKATAKTED